MRKARTISDRPPGRESPQASALVTTLLVIVVLSTIVVAFLQSMSTERRTAKSTANALQARLLADAAADEAVRRMLATTNGGPMAAVWDRDAAGNPYLYLAKRTLRGTNLVTERIPLFTTSAGGPAHFENPSANQLASGLIAVADVDASGAAVSRSVSLEPDLISKINSPVGGLTNGMVGLMSGSTPLQLPVNWTYVRDTNGRVIGRYAFWSDDECSKLDLRFAGQAANASGTHARGDGTNLSDLSLLALTNAAPAAGTSEIANLLLVRNQAGPLTNASIVQYPLSVASSAVAPDNWEKLRPYVTVFSLHDDRAPDGRRRLPLNKVVTGTNTAAAIRDETLAIRDAITNSLPDFGKRYYSASNSAPTQPSARDQEVYALKIAANIRDAVDPDNTATIIAADGSGVDANTAGFIPSDTLDGDLPAAFGKEGGPFLSEYFRVIRVIEPAPHPPTAQDTPVDITIRFGHYIELYNPTGRDITYTDLGPDPFVLLSNRTSWNNLKPVGSPSVLRLADLKIRLPAQFSIPAGGYAVLTTDGPPWRDSQTGWAGSAANRYLITAGSGPGQWELVNTGGKASASGTTYEDYAITTTAVTGNFYSLQSAAPAGASYPDQRERLALANRDGVIDYTLRIYSDPGGNQIGRNANNPAWACTFLSDPSTEISNTPSGSNTEPRFTRGDARSNTEVSRIGPDTSACWKSGNAGYGGAFPGTFSTLGLPNYNSAQDTQTGVQRWRQWWYEFTADPAGNHFVASRPMRSLGELGAIYDPVRHDIAGYRSQGATLRIGQSDSATNNRANVTGPDYQRWLGGRGSDDPASQAYRQNAFLLMDVFRTDDLAAGRINPNCLVRDNSAVAFRALLEGFTFESAATNRASPLLAGKALNVTNTLASLRQFASSPTNGFLVSVGDLSRAPLFTSSTNALAAGVSMQPVSDAGREEFLRRSANLMSTQSLAFTVYIRAQAGGFERTASGTERFRVKASAAREMVVQLQPSYPTPEDPLKPQAPESWRTLYPRILNH